jgi:1,2-diacylglycerol 3-beta-glucosyltransferase
MPVLTLILLSLALPYGVVVCLLIAAILRPVSAHYTPLVSNQPLPGVSVVIPFRNEASHLPGLLTSLNNQTYKGPVEIILVNDYSTDDYRAAVQTVTVSVALQFIDSPLSRSVKLTSKQQALEQGIRAASYDWIALTDADMVLTPDWLSSLIDQASPQTAMVFGHTIKYAGKSPSLFNWFQAFQLETLFGVAYAFDRLGLTGSCMGNNLLISRKAFNNIGGYTAMGYSIVEDCDLLRLFKKKRFIVATAQPFIPTGTTPPCPTLREFHHQLMRWAKGGFGKNPILALAGLLLCIQNLLFLLALSGIVGGPVALIVFCNLLLTWLFISIAFKKIRSTQHPLHFWPFYLLFLLESLILSLAFLFRRPIIWKERKVR